MKKQIYTVIMMLQILFIAHQLQAEVKTMPLADFSKSIHYYNVVQSKSEFIRLSLPGAVTTFSKPGEPELPSLLLEFSLPSNAKKIIVELDSPKFIWSKLEKDIVPAQSDLPLNGASSVLFIVDSCLYRSDEVYPQNIISQIKMSARGESLVVSFALTPFALRPYSRTLGILKGGTIKINYSVEGSAIFFNRTSGTKRSLPGRLPGDEAFVNLTTSLPQKPIDYLIITSESLVPCFEPLAVWRARNGLSSWIQTVEWIAANVSGTDLAEKIRNYIKACWLYGGTRYVLLGGDTRIIPERQLYYLNSYLPENRIPSDLYYSDIVDTNFASGFWSYNFNKNGNLNIGELWDNCGQDDGIDQTPDLSLGRAPVQDAAQAANFVSKVMSYEQSPSAGFADKVLILADGNFAWFGEMADQIIGPSAPWIQRHRMYNPVSGSYYQGDEILTVNNGLARLDQGYHIVYHFDHGGQYSLSLAKDHTSAGGGWIYRPQAAALQNTDRSSIIITPACSPNAYDFSSISEYLINNTRGGALAFIGNTRVGWTSQYPQFNRFFEALYQQGENRLGNIFTTMLSAGNSYGRYALNLLGDPALNIYRRQPAAITATHPRKIAGPQAQMPVALGSLSYGQTQAWACLSRGLEVIDRKLITSGGNDTFLITGLSEGWLFLTISAPDHIPYTDSCYYVPGPDSVPLFSGYSLSDICGNGDGSANPGETFFLYPLYDKTKTIEIRLRSLDPALVIEDSVIKPGVSTQNEPKEYLRIGISPDIKSDHRVQLFFAVRSQSNSDYQIFTRYLDILTDSLVLAFASYKPDRSLSADRNWYLLDSLQLANIGHGAARGIKIWLPGSDTILIGDIPSGGTTFHQAAIRFRLPQSLSLPNLMLTAVDVYGRNTEFPLLISRIPETPTMLTSASTPNGIRLHWSQNDSDLSGYNIYRKSPGQERFDKLNTFPLTQRFYVDEQALPLTPYYYTVTAISRSGRESKPAEPIMSAAGPKLSPGFPRPLGQGSTSTRMWTSPASGDINGDGYEEIVLGSDDGLIYVFDHRGQILPGWPKDLGDNPYGRKIIIEGSTPALADLDNDGRLDIIMGNGPWYGDVGDGLVHAWHHDGNELPGWPQPVAGNAFAPASADDIDGDGGNEVVAATSSGWLYLWDHQGNILPGWPVRIGTTRAMASAALGDLNGDGIKEIVAQANDNECLKLWVLKKDGQPLAGWPKVLQNGAVHALSSPVLADMDGDGIMEIVLASENSSAGISCVYCLRSDGSDLPGWPLALSSSSILSSPAIGDLNGDGQPEVVLASGNGQIHSLSHANGPVINWSASLPPNGRANPVIADIDGDSTPDVIAAAEDGYLRALRGIDGSPLSGFPILMEPSWSAPLISDVDQDGRLNLIAFGWGSHSLFNWELAASAVNQPFSWRMMGGQVGHNNCYQPSPNKIMAANKLQDNSSNQKEDNNIKTGPNPCHQQSWLLLQLSHPGPVQIDVFNILGQKVKTILNQVLDAGSHRIIWNLTNNQGMRVRSGNYFYRIENGHVQKIVKISVLD